MKVIFIFAHPDDESFSSGGTIAKLTKNRVSVKLITATKGEEGLTGNPPVCKKEDLGKVREKELKNAAKILGISKIFFLGYRDGSLKNVSISELSSRILSVLKEEKPDIVVTFNKEGGSLHPDHIRVNEGATLAFQKYLEPIKKRSSLYYVTMPRSFIEKLKKQGIVYKIYGEPKGTPDSEITTKIDISDTLRIKIKALKSHKTQNQDWERYLKRSKEKEFNYEFFELILENDLI